MSHAGQKEINFEDAIERDLLELGGYTKGDSASFDRERALFPADVFAWIEKSQPDVWATLRKEHGTSLESALLAQLTKTLAQRGALDVLRHGFKLHGRKILMAVFKPAHTLNSEIQRTYAANRLVVTRQLYYDADSKRSLDMVLSLNGLPVATMELKNSLTGQSVEHSKRQYKKDRDPHAPLFRFKERALVHFAVDTDEVYMTTRLSGKATYFLPFNRGRDGGTGNPYAEPYATAYLWREVLARDSFLDILARFFHLEVKEEERGGKKRKKETLIFPRYHQLDVVRRLVAASRDEGPGHSYLIQHSAGSGKSNSIAWTAHRLASLHDENDRKVFNSVIVITDRLVLDKQLQDTIYQFEHKQGVVVRIDKHSSQLAEALEQGTAIIITTLQKFPFVAEKIADLPDRRYAIIVDEAHSSQTGESAKAVREVLGSQIDAEPATMVAEGDADAQEKDDPTHEDEINRIMAARGRQPNLSFFAFTATPKAKTLEVFGRPGPEGKPVPYHTYTMRQAIEEGFILDVLQNYTTYKTYYRLVQKTAADRDVKKAEATRALARFMSLHPYNIAQKVEVIVEHFRAHVAGRLDGRAKAMVVTRSRLHAVRFKLAFDAYIRDKSYEGLKALVAFSGSVFEPDGQQAYTEVEMNDGLGEKELPKKFATDDYQVLIAANKYQTGFDQPLLCAMYVDKKLAGVQAVQTLSRLNRTRPGKDETFVLDFANENEEVKAAFQDFYQVTTVSEQADPDHLEVLRHELDASQIWHASEIEAFAKVFYRPKEKITDREHAELHRHLQPAIDRFLAIDDEEEREEWRSKLQSYVRLYAFLSQVMGWTDRDLEVRYSFGRLLLKRLPRPGHEDRYDPDGEVDIDFYRLARIGMSDIVLDRADGAVKPPSDVGTRKAQDEEAKLSDIIKVLNERFGTDFTESDRLLLDQVIEDGKTDTGVRERAEANTFENFALSVGSTIQELMIDRRERNEDIVNKFLDEERFRQAVSEHVAKEMYEAIRRASG